VHFQIDPDRRSAAMAFHVRRVGAVFFLTLLAPLGATAARADDIPSIVVTPTYIPTAISRAGSAITVISHDQIVRSNAGSVVQLLQTVPGLSITESGGVGSSTTVSIRGAEPGHTLVLIDGVRVNEPSAASGGFDFSQLTLTDIERIEVVRGPQSALYGSDAMGGVINIITKKAAKGQSHSSVTAEGGSYGTERVSASASKSEGAFSLAGSGTWFNTTGFSRQGNRDHDEPDGARKFAGNVNGSIDAGGGVRLDFGLDGFNETAGFDESGNPDAKSTQTRDLVNGYSKLSFPSLDGWLHNSINVFAMDDSRHVYDDTATPSVTDFHGTDVGAEYQGDFTLGSHGTFLFGTRVEQETGAVVGGWTPFSSSRNLYAFYAMQQLNVGDRLHLSFGGRYDGANEGEGFLTGRATAVYDISETETRLRASIGTGAKRPTFYELYAPIYGNADLKDETSWGADTGIDQTLFDGRITLSATAFYDRFRNLIDFNPPSYVAVNVTDAETAGAELSGTANIVPGKLSASATYTYLYARNLANGLPLSRRPENSGTLALTYTGIDRLSATLAATFVGTRTNSPSATLWLPAYTRVDVNADYRLNDHVTLFGRIVNLFNATYQDPSGYNTSGLAVYAGLTATH
jgi:vitamin B12 transporter